MSGPIKQMVDFSIWKELNMCNRKDVKKERNSPAKRITDGFV